MQLGIDWVSAGIFAVAYIVGQMGRFSLRMRYTVWAVACLLIAFFRLRYGFAQMNGIFTGLAVLLGAYYGYKALRAPSR
jgi:hypothetical protein